MADRPRGSLVCEPALPTPDGGRPPEPGYCSRCGSTTCSAAQLAERHLAAPTIEMVRSRARRRAPVGVQLDLLLGHLPAAVVLNPPLRPRAPEASAQRRQRSGCGAIC